MKQFYSASKRCLLIHLTLLLVSASAWAQSIQVTNVTTTPVCAGGLVTITFDVTNGPATNGNGQKFRTTATTYTVDLVLAGSPTQSLGTLTPTLPSSGYSTDPNGKTTGIKGTVTIPVGTLTNSAYKISLTSSAPNATGISSEFTVNAKPSAPTVTVVNNCNGTSTLTATNYTGSLLWSNGTTTAVNTVNTAGTYTVTQTVNGCMSSNGSGIAAPKTTPLAPTPNNVTVTYNGSAHTATATAQPEASVAYYTASTLGSLTSAPTKTDAGTYTVWAESSSNGCISMSRTQVTLAINKAASTIALTVGGPYTYDNTAKSVTSATVSGAGGLSTNAVVAYSQSGSPIASPINAGSYNVVASYAGDANHEAATNVPGNLVIGKAAASLALSGLTYTYDGTAKTVTVTTTPSGLSGVSVSGDNQTNAGTYPVTASLDNLNYTAPNATANLVIGKATASLALSGLMYTYDGTAKTVTVTTTPTGLSGVSVSGDSKTNAGTYPVTASLDNLNYTAPNATANLVIGKATASLALSGLMYTYDGTAKTVTVTTTPTGLTGVTVSGDSKTNAGTYPVTASLDNLNYTAPNATANLVINKATASLALSDLSYTYDGTAKTVTVTTTPSGLSGVSVSGDSKTNAGTYPVTASLTNDNYTAPNATANLVINKATASLALSDLSYTYDGTAKTVTVTTTPSGLSGVSVSGDSKTNAGTYPVTASLTNDNYTAPNATANLVINKATASLALSDLSYTYDGTAKTVTVTTTPSGLSGVSVSGDSKTNAGTYPVTASLDNLNYTAPNATANLVIGKATASLALSGLMYTYDGTAKTVTVTTTPTGLTGVTVSGDSKTNAGTYPVTASLDNLNYTAPNATANLVIGKADALVTVTGYTGTYDGVAHGATGTAKGVGGSAVGTLSLGSSFTDVPGGMANWTFDGGTNYNNNSGSVAIVINKANAIVNVTGYSGVYNGVAHGATGTATGAGGANLIGSLNLGNTFTNVPGGTADWIFSGGINYNDQSGSVAITINKATASVTPNAKSKVYGSSDPVLDGSLTGFVAEDGITASYTRTPGETVMGSPYSISAALSPGAALANYTITYNTANFTISSKPVSVVAEAKTRVYGTPNPALTYTFSPALIASDAFSGSLSVGAGTYSDVGAYDIVQGTLDLGPNYTINYSGAKLTITPQTANPLADAYYTGATFFWTQGATNANATLTLSATLKNSPNYGGDIRTAKVSFFIRNGSSKVPINGAQNLPVGLVNPGDLAVGATAVTVQYNIGSADVSTLNIGIDVSGNYTSNPSVAYDKVITVAKPVPGGQIVGGADINATGSAGYVKGAANVGFFVQYNKSLKNPQGGVELKVTSSLNRSGVADGLPHTYKIKSNAISVLSVGKPTIQDAQFTSKANIAEIVGGVEQPIEGNCTLQFDMTDVGSSGAGDKVGITVYRNGGGVWYSSNWDGTKTLLKAIEASGQVSVSTAGARLAAEEVDLNLVLETYPNPTRDLLKISVSGAGEQPTAQLKLYNLLQRVAGEWTLDLKNGKGEKTIDVRMLEGGTYLLSVEGNQKRSIKRVVKVD